MREMPLQQWTDWFGSIPITTFRPIIAQKNNGHKGTDFAGDVRRWLLQWLGYKNLQYARGVRGRSLYGRHPRHSSSKRAHAQGGAGTSARGRAESIPTVSRMARRRAMSDTCHVVTCAKCAKCNISTSSFSSSWKTTGLVKVRPAATAPMRTAALSKPNWHHHSPVAQIV